MPAEIPEQSLFNDRDHRAGNLVIPVTLSSEKFPKAVEAPGTGMISMDLGPEADEQEEAEAAA